MPPYSAGRAGVGLLERLEDEPLLLRRDTDAGVLDGEGDDLVGVAEHRVIGTSSPAWRTRRELPRGHAR